MSATNQLSNMLWHYVCDPIFFLFIWLFISMFIKEKRTDVPREENFVACPCNVNNPKVQNTLKNNMRRITSIFDVFVLIL